MIDEPGRVDDGSTQTDSLAMERERGITIKSAVVSFVVDGVTVNLIDTPGHPDFIAEVERVLSVLDGAVLVVSAVEGVQAQTRALMRALPRLRIPFRLEAPADALAPLLPVLGELGAVPEAPLVRGEGIVETDFDGYERVRGNLPERPRTDDNPLNRAEHLQRVAERTAGRRAAV